MHRTAGHAVFLLSWRSVKHAACTGVSTFLHSSSQLSPTSTRPNHRSPPAAGRLARQDPSALPRLRQLPQPLACRTIAVSFLPVYSPSYTPAEWLLPTCIELCSHHHLHSSKQCLVPTSFITRNNSPCKVTPHQACFSHASCLHHVPSSLLLSHLAFSPFLRIKATLDQCTRSLHIGQAS